MDNIKPIAETLETAMRRIQETLTSPKAQPTTPKPLNESEKLKRKNDWISKWLSLELTHPQLTHLADEVYRFCSSYAQNPRQGYRMIIHGENGVGKSHAAKAIARWASRVALLLPLVPVDGPELGFRLADAQIVNWAQAVDDMKAGHWDLLEPLLECSLLVLDDVGAEHDPSKVGSEKLYLLLERREYKWTVLTTNARPMDWDLKFERRIASRFFRNAEHVALDQVPDYNSL